MPLDAYIAEAMGIMKAEPDTTEVCVANVRRLRLAAEAISYETIFRSINNDGNDGDRSPARLRLEAKRAKASSSY
jgi:hypothetical protein